ncbi:TPA: hypothetical protein DEP34_03365 [Candidatus Uhrbacteria bacterium]|uniref:Uncharacterized protein n=2 Tax=Candidatus Uhriibacteriota TaxID=1752732 RepID=A0A0G1Q8K0_9BACT|nr:MAG: hypothetical protein UX45_C0009G0027 [Candidatus Uhrbacteria bacterium GW2011_GWF2_46_218]KKU41324.1 MAG: hypothetical protein UX57_C0004G0028 [Candidatus Uhrbacteria bacterium GW2011_GWE2_46_68]HBK33761.1 hypothetical protein [Candidatus Uhrbacteria bacterium]HCB19398.1 hypothetical protein [Candidatus Uhrbacteria bacterium]
MRRPEHHSQLLQPERTTRSRETESLSPILFATQRPELPQNDQAIYDAWVEEVKAIFARVGAKNTEDFKRMAREKPESVTLKELERVCMLMDRIAFTWRHDRLPPKMPEQQGEFLEDMEIQFDTNLYALVSMITAKEKAFFIISEKTKLLKPYVVMDQHEEKSPPTFSIPQGQLIGNTLVYTNNFEEGAASLLLIDHKPVSRYVRKENIGKIVDVQGKPAWTQQSALDKPIFIYLDHAVIGNTEGYDEIAEFESYGGKLLFQARKGKQQHTFFDGKEVHPPTENREMYRHFGEIKGQPVYTKTEEKNWIVKKVRRVGIYHGQTLMHEIKGAGAKDVELYPLKDGQGDEHIATVCSSCSTKECPICHKQAFGHFHTWIDGHLVEATSKCVTKPHRVSMVGNALAYLGRNNENFQGTNLVSFHIDGFSPKFPYEITDYVMAEGELFFVGYRVQSDVKNHVVILKGLHGEPIWTQEVRGSTTLRLEEKLPKLNNVLGKLFYRVYVEDGWRTYYDGRQLDPQEGAESLGDPVTVGTHILYVAKRKENYELLDEFGDSYGNFSFPPRIEPIDDSHCYVHAQEEVGAKTKLVRRLITL